MSYLHRGARHERLSPPVRLRATPPSLPAAPERRVMPLTRRIETLWAGPDGRIEDSARIVPVLPQFDEATSALTRGTVIATPGGPVAVEDLVPGMEVLPADGGATVITWIGSAQIYPRAGDEPVSLVRFTADALGYGRPGHDVVLGPRARVLMRDPRIRAFTGTAAAFVPARAFVDGVSVIEITPSAPVTVFHLALARHGALRAAGLGIESYHPGQSLGAMMDPRMLSLFKDVFPQIDDLDDFGPPAHPRLTRFEVDQLMG